MVSNECWEGWRTCEVIFGFMLAFEAVEGHGGGFVRRVGALFSAESDGGAMGYGPSSFRVASVVVVLAG